MNELLADPAIEYQKHKELKKEDVQRFMEWCSKQLHFPQVHELQCILCLQSCDFDIAAAKKTLEAYFTHRTLAFDLFGKPDLLDSIKETIDTTLSVVLPDNDPQGAAIVLAKIIDPDSNYYVFLEQCQYFLNVILIHLHTRGTVKEIKMIIDLDNVKPSYGLRIGLNTLKKDTMFLQEGLPCKMKAMHLINVNPLIEKLVNVMKTFMKKELFQLIYVHKSSDQLTEYFPQECLIEEYRGKNGNIPTLHANVKKMLRENIKLLSWLDSQKIDVNKKSDKSVDFENVFGSDGSFICTDFE